jgi:DNA-binding PucR family transcriptional regulator
MLPYCHGMLYRNSILLMLGADGMIENMDEALAPIIPVLDEYGFVAGVSNMFRSIHEIRKYAVQSVEALRLGMALHRDRTVYCYRDYAIYYMIEVCLKNESIDMFCLPEVMQFIERCQEHGANIVDTLRSYLRCGRNKTQVSKDMYVHRSTVKYRMAQIQNILGISLDSDENALKIMLSMKMLEYRDAFPNDEFPSLIRPPRSTLHENIKSE